MNEPSTPIGQDFAGDSEVTERVPYQFRYLVRKIVDGVVTVEDPMPFEFAAHDLLDVWKREKHVLPFRIDIVEIVDGAERVIARWTSDGVETAT